MKKTILVIMMLSAMSLSAISASPAVTADSISYACKITNIVQQDTATLTFDVYITNTGLDTLKFASLDGNVSFDYFGISNGGTLAGAFVPGSASASLATIQKTPDWNVDPVTKHIIMKSYAAPVVGSCFKIPYTDSVKIGTFILVDTKPFKINSTASFVWKITPGSSLARTSALKCYILHDTQGRDTTCADLTIAADMVTRGNPVLNPQ